jgi:hypothetical protein
MCKEFVGGSTTHPMERGLRDVQLLEGQWLLCSNSGYYEVTVVAMEATRTIGILANVDCCNGVTW